MKPAWLLCVVVGAGFCTSLPSVAAQPDASLLGGNGTSGGAQALAGVNASSRADAPGASNATLPANASQAASPTPAASPAKGPQPNATRKQPRPRQASGELTARRLSFSVSAAATLQGPLEVGLASNLATASLTEDGSVAVALEDYGNGRKGGLALCQVSGSDVTCGAAEAFTSEPIHHAAGSLAIGALLDTHVALAWKQGSSPYIGHVRVCPVELSDFESECGPDYPVRAEWGAVSVAILASTSIVFAYSDVQRGHRGAIVRCDVAGLSSLNCDLAHIFEQEPVGALAVAALHDSNLAYTLPLAATDVLVAYEVELAGGRREGRLQPCLISLVMGLPKVKCEARSTLNFNDGVSTGVNMLALSSTAFVIGYTDLQETCDATMTRTSQQRRRALYVCDASVDQHPSIGRTRLCHATFRGLAVSRPFVTCGSSMVVDDGLSTGVPRLAKSVDDDVSFAAAYVCEGCDDLGSRGLARLCQVSALPAEGETPVTPSCGAATAVNADTTRFVSVAATSSGYVVAYDDYAATPAVGAVRFVL